MNFEDFIESLDKKKEEVQLTNEPLTREEKKAVLRQIFSLLMLLV
jgi:hypothetical protein